MIFALIGVLGAPIIAKQFIPAESPYHFGPIVMGAIGSLVGGTIGYAIGSLFTRRTH